MSGAREISGTRPELSCAARSRNGFGRRPGPGQSGARTINPW